MPVVAALYSASFVRPNDALAYASGDLVANNTVAGAVVPMQIGLSRNPSRQRITRARLMKTSVGFALAAFRAHLFSAAPVVAVGDNGVLATTGAASYLGAIDFPVAAANMLSDGLRLDGVPITGPSIIVPMGADTGIVYALLEARAAYVPTALETFTLSLECDSVA